MNNFINKLIKLKVKKENFHLQGKVEMFAHKAGTKELLFNSVNHNLIMQGGLLGYDMVIQWLIGNMGPTGSALSLAGGINYGEIGTGTTTPALTDTGNTAGVARAIPSSSQDLGNNQAVLQFYFPDASLPNQIYGEFATFVAGNISLGSGNIFNHALFGTAYNKPSGVDITVQVTFTLSQ